MMSIISKYDRFSHIYDLFETPMEMMFFRKWRRSILSDLHGRVLEVGVGTGKNLKYYPSDCQVVGVDISKKMLMHAKKRSEEMGNVSLFVMDAQNLGFADNSFDHVVTTFVLCSIPDPVASLYEMKRVCKSDGTIVNLEHMRSSNRLISLVEDILNPVTVFLTGVNVNRRTVENIRKAGIKVVEEKHLAMKDVFRLTRSKP